jgi:deoxyribose-phosphate aldolase
MVIDLGAAKASRFADVRADIAAVRANVPALKVLKVIIESAALTDAEIVAVCEAAVAAGADFVKTSTGFHPAGGATVHAVRLMKQTVGNRAQVKASGGVRSFEDAITLINAGATRFGVCGSTALPVGAPPAGASGNY